METASQAYKIHAIEKAANNDYMIVITPERFNGYDYEQTSSKDANNANINRLLRERKQLAKELIKGNHDDTQIGIELFERYNEKIRQFLLI